VASEASGSWTLDAAAGELTVRTGVAGRAARMGHRLTLAMTRWQAGVKWVEGEPSTGELVVEVDSLQVLRGEGGVKGLSGPEKTVARSNALKSLSASRFPQIRFLADVIAKTEDGYRLQGTLHIRGNARPHTIDLRTDELGDSWRLAAESTVRQSDFGVKPFSMLLGSLRVADEVAVFFSALRRDSA
jgi:polyisoprenoid-binding protein YceI